MRRGAVSPWLPALGTVCGEVVGIAGRALTGDPKYLLIGPALGLLLGAAKYLGGRDGARRVVAESPAGRRVGLLAAAAAVLWLAGVAAFPLFAAAARPPRWAALAVVLWPFPPLFWLILRAAPELRSFTAARRAEAVAEWDALHADPQREPAWQAELWDGADGERDSGDDRRR